MKGAKKLATIIALLVVIIAAIASLVMRLEFGERELPKWFLEDPVEKIDKDTLELITLKLGEWEKLGQKEGKYRNPKTGSYSMVTPIVCDSCAEKIAPPDYPPREEATAGEVLEIRSKFMCPKCGKPAFVTDYPG